MRVCVCGGAGGRGRVEGGGFGWLGGGRWIGDLKGEGVSSFRLMPDSAAAAAAAAAAASAAAAAAAATVSKKSIERAVQGHYWYGFLLLIVYLCGFKFFLEVPVEKLICDFSKINMNFSFKTQKRWFRFESEV